MSQDALEDEIAGLFEQFTDRSREELLAARSLDEFVDWGLRIEVLLELEERYQLDIPDDEVLAAQTVDDIRGCILRSLRVAAG